MNRNDPNLRKDALNALRQKKHPKIAPARNAMGEAYLWVPARGTLSKVPKTIFRLLHCLNWNGPSLRKGALCALCQRNPTVDPPWNARGGP